MPFIQTCQQNRATLLISIFPVICLRIAELSKRNNSLYTIIGQSQLIPITNEYKSETPVKIRNKNTEFIPKIIQNGSYEFIDLSGAEAIEKLKPGNYTIEADKTIGSLSLNIDRKESSIDYMSTEGITKALKSKKLKNIEVDQFSKNSTLKNKSQSSSGILADLYIYCDNMHRFRNINIQTLEKLIHENFN